MGLVTYVCFLICAVSLVLSVDGRAKRLQVTAITISATALVVSVYALAQYFGFDPFVSPETYTFNSAYGPIVRVASSLGHADYLGNFLLYTTPLSVALTLSLRSSIRWLTLVSAIASLAAIAVSGTRGAWLGIIIGLAGMVALALKSRAAALVSFSRPSAIMAAGILVVIGTSAAAVIISARGWHSISARAQQTVAEGMSGSGRILLWRDALLMMPRYAFPGCGPEAFRLAFPLYRSEELSRLAPTVINESAHNSYLDAAVSFGLPGLVALVALIAPTLVYFYRARRDDSEPRTRLLTVGFLSSFIAVLTHNFFIFDQLATGLYFFAFAALAVCALEVSEPQADADADSRARAAAFSLRAGVITAVTLVVSAAAAWYAINSWADDVALKQMLGAARTGALDTVIARGNALTNGRSLTGDFDLQFASALTIALGRTPSAPGNGALPQADLSSRKHALDLAIEHAARGVNHTLTPTTGHLLLGTLALMKGDKPLLREAAHETYRQDPNGYGSHWLLAESYLADGYRQDAICEAQVALSLNASSQESRAVLERDGAINREQAIPSELLAKGRELAQQGRLAKARRLILRAIRRSDQPCFDCHVALADLYEQAGEFNEAATELQRAISDNPVNPQREEVRKRISDLRAKSGAGVNPSR